MFTVHYFPTLSSEGSWGDVDIFDEDDWLVGRVSLGWWSGPPELQVCIGGDFEPSPGCGFVE